MTNRIEESFAHWLIGLAKAWGLSDQDVALRLGEEEILNRFTSYPKVSACLTKSPLNLHEFDLAVSKCWALGARYDRVRFNAFVTKGKEAAEAIESLISYFPKDDEAAAERIDSFTAHATSLGYSKPEGNPDRAGAAQLASCILTSLEPERFADYRRSRWEKFAEAFEYPTRGRESWGLDRLGWQLRGRDCSNTYI